MENKINFKKEIKFDTMIYEITEINIDIEYEINDYTIDGKYLINGYYKDSEIKIGNEPFDFVIPFSIELDNNVLLETVELKVNDFDYKINNNVLIVNINNVINYDENNIEPESDDLFDLRDDLEEDNIVIDDSEEEIINEPINNEDGYVKYYIHVVKENETIESIAAIYHTSSNNIINYNNEPIKPGVKLIIPNEE